LISKIPSITTIVRHINAAGSGMVVAHSFGEHRWLDVPAVQLEMV